MCTRIFYNFTVVIELYRLPKCIVPYKQSLSLKNNNKKNLKKIIYVMHLLTLKQLALLNAVIKSDVVSLTHAILTFKSRNPERSSLLI